MEGHSKDASELLLHAACGVPLAAEAGLLSRLLLSSGGAPTVASTYELQPSAICRVLLHAGASVHHLQHLLEEVQSAVVLCPAVVPQLLETLLPQQRQELALRLTQLRQQYIDYQQQQEPQDGVLPDPAAAEAFMQQLQELSAVDVLLMTSLASQQWQADVSFVLMQGVMQSPSLQQLSSLLQELAATADAAAAWLMDVGLNWCRTCHLDLPQGFEAAGVRLLQAAVWSKPQLSTTTLQRVVKHLLAESAPNSHFWAVLQYAVQQCCHWHSSHQHQQQQQAMQTPLQLDRPATAGAVVAGAAAAAAGDSTSALAAVCEQELLAGLTAVMSCLQQQQECHLARVHSAQMAVNYCSTIAPLAAVSCDVLQALLQCAVDAAQQHQGLPLQKRGNAAAVKVEEECLPPQQQEQQQQLEGITVHGRHSPRTAAAAGGAGGGSRSGTHGVIGSGSGSVLQTPGFMRKTPRYSWGLNQRRPVPAFSSPAACGVPLQGTQQGPQGVPKQPQQQQQWQERMHGAGAIAGADKDVAVAAQQLHLSEMQPQQVVPSQSQSQRSHEQQQREQQQHADQHAKAEQKSGDAQNALLSPGDAAAQLKHQLELLRSLQGQPTSSQPVKSQAGRRQLPSAAVVAAAADLPPYEQLAVAAAADALCSAAVGSAGPCDSAACQAFMASLLQELLAGLSAAAVKQLSEVVAQVLQHQQQGQGRQCRCCNKTQPLLPLQQPQNGAAQQPDNQRAVSRVTDLWYQAVLQQLQSAVSASLQSAAAAAAAAGSAQDLESGGRVCTPAGSMPIVLNPSVPVLLQLLAAEARQGVGSCSSSRGSSRQDSQLQMVLAQLLLLLLMVGSSAAGAAPNGSLIATTTTAAAAGSDGVFPAAAAADGTAGHAARAPAAAQTNQAASEAVRQCTARAAQLLLRWRTLSLLLSWLLQDAGLAEAVAQEVTATAARAAAGGSSDHNTLPAQPPAAAGELATSAEPQVANPGAAVRQPLQPALEKAVLCLQQLQQGQLPAALDLLATAHTAAVKEQQEAAAAVVVNSQQRRLDAYGGWQDQGGGSAPGSSQKKRSKQEGGFFVIKRTPAAAAAAAASPTKSTAAAGAGGAAPVPMDSTSGLRQNGVERQQQGPQQKAQQRLWQLAPSLLQPPEPLGMQACVRLLGAACSSIQDAQAALQQHRQQEQQQGQLVGATPNSRRHSSRLGSSPAPSAVAAAQAAGGMVGSVPDAGSGTAAGQHTPGADEAAAAGAAAAGSGAEVTAAGMLSAAAAAAVGTSGSTGSSGSAAQLATSLQQAMQLSQLAVASILEASKVHTHQQLQLQQEQQKHEHCLHAVVLLLELARLCRMGTGPIQQQQQLLQQVSGLACSCVGAAAELLETWWDHLCSANDGTTSSNGSSLHEAAAAAAQQLQPLLLPGLGHDRVGGGGSSSGARRHSSGALGGSTAELFGVQYSQVLHVLQLGPSGWAHTCKVAQQEPLLGLLLALSCQVDAQLSQLDELCQEAARRQHTPAATAATAEVAAAHVTAQVKLLAALRKIAEGVYAPAALEAAGAPASQPEALAPSATAAATVLQPGRVASGSGGGSSGGSSSSKAHWLLGALDHWLLELAVGFSLDPCIASLPKAASACARHALLLSITCRPPRRSSSNSSSLFSSPTLNTARLVHCMCLHYSPRVYLAGSVGAGRVWGRGGGLEAGPGKGPAWVLSLSRQAAADVARQTLTFLTHKLTGLVMVTSPGGSLGSSQGSSSSGVCGTVVSDAWGQILAAKGSMEAVAAGSEGLDSAAVQGLLNWLCEQAAAVATVCCCVELLLGCRTAAAKAAAQAHSHQQRLLLGAEGTEDLDAVAREARAVFAALTAVLSGPCLAAAAALRQQLCTMQQQEEAQGLQAGVDMQQRLHEPAAEQQPDAADTIAAAAATALAGGEAGAAVSEVMSPVGIMAAAEVGDVCPTGLGQPQDQAAAEAAAPDQQMANASDAVTPTPVSKQGRGRPRKYPLVSPPATTGPKRGRGRPRKDAPPATPAAGAAADVLAQDAEEEEATELAPPAAGDDHDAVADSTAAAAANNPAASQPATAADGADSTAAPPASASQAARHRNSSVSKAAAKQQQLLAARAQEADKKVDACQEMLCILAGLGVAVGELSVRMFNPQRQQQQSQHDQLQLEQQLHGGSGIAGGCGAAAGVWVQALQQQQQQQQQPGPDLLQQLQQQLRAWPAEWQALQADLSTASNTEQQDASAAARAVAAGAAAVAKILEGSVQLCRVQRRKDAWEAVKAAAAAADAADDSGSDADVPDSPARPPRPGSAGAAERVSAAAGRQDSRRAQLGIDSVGQAASAAAAALAAARFCDPDVREELPYIFGVLTSDDEDDQPSPAAAVAGGAGNCRTAAPAAGSNPGTAAAAIGVGALDCDAFNGFRTPARRILNVAAPGSSARRPAAGATGGLAALAEAAAATVAVRTAPGSSGGFKTPASVPPRSQHSVVKPAAAAVADLGGQLELEATFATPRQAQRTPQQQQQQQRTGAGHSTPGTAAAALAAAKRAAAAAQLVRSGAVLSPERRSAAAAGGSSRGAATAVTPSAGAHKQPRSSTKQAQMPACTPTSAGQRQLQRKESAPAPSPMVAQQQKGKLSAEQQQLGVVEVFCAGLSAQYNAAQNMVGLQDGTWVTPSAFEKLAGKGSCKNWKKSVLVRVSTGQGDAEGDKFVSVCKWLSGEVSAAGVHAAEQQQQQGPQRGSGAKKRGREDEGAQVQLEEEHEEGGVSEEDWEAQQQQPQQPRVTPAAKRRRLANGSAAKQRKQQQQQQQQDPNSDSLEPESQEPVRNSFIAACLNEARRRGGGGVNSGSQRSRTPAPARQAGRGGASAAAATGCSDLSKASDDDDDDDDDDEACEGDGEDDYSDLEDFIVCEPSTDYSKLLSRLGKQVSWRHCWRGAGKGRH